MKRASSHWLSKRGRKLFEKRWLHKAIGFHLIAGVVLAGFVFPKLGFAGEVMAASEAESAPLILKTATETSFQLPLRAVYALTSSFSVFHPGLDLAAEIGTKVYPVANGMIVEVQNLRTGYGKTVIINHGGGYWSRYAHLSEITVKKDEEIQRDRVLGAVGNSGHATGPHLHLEVYYQSRPINPGELLPSLIPAK